MKTLLSSHWPLSSSLHKELFSQTLFSQETIFITNACHNCILNFKKAKINVFLSFIINFLLTFFCIVYAIYEIYDVDSLTRS